jgi:predicted Zn-dependent protease
LCLGSLGCQQLYGGKPEKLRSPGDKKKKPADKEDQVAAIKYVEECSANFRDDPKRVFRDKQGSNTLVQAGDDSQAQAVKLTDPQSQAESIKVAIDKYRNALQKDPYNAEATLKLARAYDHVYRKGCALKLLARIATLEGHPNFRTEAKRAADQVADSSEWFKGYRKEALAAVGR